MKKLFLCFICIVLIGMVLMHRPLLTLYAELWSVNNASKQADALVVLAGRVATRFPHALELYQKGYAKKILLTEVRSFNYGIRGFNCSEQKIARAIRDHFEPDAPLFVVPSPGGKGCRSTFDEAWSLLACSKREKYKRIIIATDAFHTRRALYAFEKVFQDSGIIVEAMGAPNDMYNEQNWWRTDRGLKDYLLEPMLMCVYLFSSSNLEFVKNY
jgi:uncharacterized SAM-binding protein YcdF (DUF218 family)